MGISPTFKFEVDSKVYNYAVVATFEKMALIYHYITLYLILGEGII